MTRRGLLGFLAAAAADPEKLLWTPGKKLISIPAPVQPEVFTILDEFLIRDMLAILKRNLVFHQHCFVLEYRSVGDVIAVRTPARFTASQASRES